MKMYSNVKPSQIFMQIKNYQKHVGRVIEIHGQHIKKKSKLKRSPKKEKSQQQTKLISNQKQFSPSNFKNRVCQYQYQSTQDLYLKNLKNGRQNARYRQKQEVIQQNFGQIVRLLDIDRRNPQNSLVQTARSTNSGIFIRSQQNFGNSHQHANSKGITHNSYYRQKAQLTEIRRQNQSLAKRIINCKPQVNQISQLHQQHKKNKKYKNLNRKLPIIQKYKKIYQNHTANNIIISHRTQQGINFDKKKPLKNKEQTNINILENKNLVKSEKNEIIGQYAKLNKQQVAKQINLLNQTKIQKQQAILSLSQKSSENKSRKASFEKLLNHSVKQANNPSDISNVDVGQINKITQNQVSVNPNQIKQQN